LIGEIGLRPGPTPYLIAHKVCGKPTFDVAICCNDMGCVSDPGPWWIIPTTGHRAYPYWWEPLNKPIPKCPPDWREHYAAPEKTIGHVLDAKARQLLTSLGLTKSTKLARRI